VLNRLRTLLIALLALACNPLRESQSARIETDEGWHALVLPIVESSRTSEGRYAILAKGNLSGREIGIRVLLKPNMPPGLVGEEIVPDAVVDRGVLVESLGEPTTRLVAELAAAYEVNLPNGPIREAIPWTTIALGGDPRNIQTEYLRLKVFHDDVEERGQYYELFLHVDLPEKLLVLTEKDQDYRENIVLGFFE